MLSLFLVSPLKNPFPFSFSLLTNPPIPNSLSRYSPTLGIQHFQAQGPVLPLMFDKATLCYICSWSHGYSD